MLALHDLRKHEMFLCRVKTCICSRLFLILQTRGANIPREVPLKVTGVDSRHVFDGNKSRQAREELRGGGGGGEVMVRVGVGVSLHMLKGSPPHPSSGRCGAHSRRRGSHRLSPPPHLFKPQSPGLPPTYAEQLSLLCVPRIQQLFLTLLPRFPLSRRRRRRREIKELLEKSHQGKKKKRIEVKLKSPSNKSRPSRSTLRVARCSKGDGLARSGG